MTIHTEIRSKEEYVAPMAAIVDLYCGFSFLESSGGGFSDEEPYPGAWS